MSKEVADQIAETLAAVGMERIYGVVGDGLKASRTPCAGKERLTGCICATKRRVPSLPVRKPISQASWPSARDRAVPGTSSVPYSREVSPSAEYN